MKKYNIKDQNIIKLIENGDLVILLIDYTNLKDTNITFYITDAFREYAKKEYGTDSDINPETVLIGTIWECFYEDFARVLRYNGTKTEEEIDEIIYNTRSIFNDTIHYSLNSVTYFKFYHEEYKKHCIDTTLKLFEPIPEDQLKYMNFIDSVMEYHTRILFDEMESIMNRLCYLPALGFTITNIEKLEDRTEVFTISTPTDTKFSIWLYTISNFRSFFEDLWIKYRKAVFVSKYKYGKIDQVDYKVKVITYFRNEEKDKKDAYDEAYETYIATILNHSFEKKIK